MVPSALSGAEGEDVAEFRPLVAHHHNSQLQRAHAQKQPGRALPLALVHHAFEQGAGLVQHLLLVASLELD